jgi:GNAT superfamily N-acetyltransferase
VKGVTIREYRASDFDALTSLWLASWESAGVRAPFKATLTALRRRMAAELADLSIHVAARRERIVGFVALRGSNVDQIFVHPAAQSCGIGKSLLDFVKQQLPDGFWLWTQVQNQRARQFYQREGLVPGKPVIRRAGYRTIRYDWRPNSPGSGKKVP